MILAQNDEADVPRKEVSRLIKNLRSGIMTLIKLLIVFSSRYTFWPKT
jgi:hypothetical protein